MESETGPPLGRAGNLIARRIDRHGPIPFHLFMDEALYGAQGFYTCGGGAGRQRDFLTGPEVGPLYGAVMARALDEWWTELGRPDPFVVAECGAGPGTLAVAILQAKPACAVALRYLLVERSARLRDAQATRLTLAPIATVLGAVVDGDPDEPREPRPGQGPFVASIAELPSVPFVGVVLANELLDNLVVDLFERTTTGWAEVRVGHEGPLLVRADEAGARGCDRLAPDAKHGARISRQEQAGVWLRSARDVLEEGRVVVIDYASMTSQMAQRPWTDWLRTYRAHAAGLSPFEAPGDQDITCEVAIDQLAQIRNPSSDRTQAEFLRAHGIEDLVEEGRRVWAERSSIGDLAAVTARSRITEAAALTDPVGLGRLRVLEWVVPARRT